ncbi:hypothetical protein K439DRAFT_1552213 [Ramaria rubella]|nr:hypothetical protein K439DRAFT_1552213 [Ramaria rubella]
MPSTQFLSLLNRGGADGIDRPMEEVFNAHDIPNAPILPNRVKKPVLYVYAGCVWATAPQLAIYELGYGDDIVEKQLNLAEGANFQPSFLRLNPNATLPTLSTPEGTYTSTKEVLRYLLQNAPKAGGKSSHTHLISKLHSTAIDPNFSMLAARSEEDIKAKAKGFGLAYVRGRQYLIYLQVPEIDELLGQHTLERLARTAPEHQAFYRTKLAQNGFLLSLLDNTASSRAVKAFIARSIVHWKNVLQFILVELPTYLPDSGFIGGDRPGEDDFHLAVWLARTVGILGGSPNTEGIKTLEKELGGCGTVPKKVQNYWKLWSGRNSWRIQYGQLH